MTTTPKTTIRSTDHPRIKAIYQEAQTLLQLAGTHKLRRNPWFRGVNEAIEKQLLEETNNPLGLPDSQRRHLWQEQKALQKEFAKRLSKGIYGSGLQGQKKVAHVLSHFWLELHTNYALGGEFLCWLDLRFNLPVEETIREEAELEAQTLAEQLMETLEGGQVAAPFELNNEQEVTLNPDELAARLAWHPALEGDTNSDPALFVEAVTSAFHKHLTWMDATDPTHDPTHAEENALSILPLSMGTSPATSLIATHSQQ